MRHIVTAVCALTLLASASTGCDTQGETVGPRGGQVVSEDGRFALEIPQGALDHDVDIVIEQVDCDAAVVGACYEVQPTGTTLLKPARATFELGGMELGDMDPEGLALVIEHESDWNKLADRIVDTDDEVLEASALYLSSFAVASFE